MCATYTTSGGSERGYTYSWDEAWATDGEGVASEVNVRKNHGGFKGVELACEKADVPFTIDEASDQIMAVSSDTSAKMFSITWVSLNDPTGNVNVDDITTATSIPEFSTILMPILSVLMVFGINNKTKRDQH